jgi:hypothetical protein
MLVRRKRHNLLCGFYVTCAILLGVAVVLLIQIGLSYNGICTGAIPEVAAPAPCSFWEYMSRNTILLCLVLAPTYWPLVLTIVLLPPFVGYLIDWRNQQAT